MNAEERKEFEYRKKLKLYQIQIREKMLMQK